jgi:hypothetical protein
MITRNTKLMDPSTATSEGLNKQGASTDRRDLTGDLLVLVNAEAADNDVRPFFGKRQRSGFADAGGASRDKDSLVFESCHTHRFSSFRID